MLATRCALALCLVGLLFTGHAYAAADVVDTSADEQTLKGAGIGTDGSALLEFFRKRTLSDSDRERIKGLVGQLGDDSFEVREKASAALVSVGAAAEPFLREATKSSDVEVVRRAEDCLRVIERGAGAGVSAAAARLIAQRKPAGAVPVLLAYIHFADNEVVADEVRSALAALAVHEGKSDPQLIAALSDGDPVRRAAAAEALCRGGAVEAISSVSKLLQDPDPAVRLRVATALAAAKDRDAVPVLIGLLGVLPPDQAWPAEDILLRLAGDQAPAIALGNDESSRSQCRNAWMAWWQSHQANIDMARLQGAGQVLGYTLLLLLDAGQAMEVDAKGRILWQFGNLQFPLDIQYLPGNRVLVAEHGDNRVTERNLKGDVLWEKKIETPLAAQRLPNGNTFIATPSQLVEVDPLGKQVSVVHPGLGGEVMKAAKLRNGDIACVVFGAGYLRMDATGKELQSFAMDVRTAGGKVDVLPNGHVLVPELEKNRVAEYDTQGKCVWEAEIQRPIAAVHLPNGNCLVTTMNQNRAVEIDRAGKEVWEYRANTRVNRAFRR